MLHLLCAIFGTNKFSHSSETSPDSWVKVVLDSVVSSSFTKNYLPVSDSAMTVHLFPWILWSLNISYYSTLVHPFFSMPGFKWLCQLDKAVNTAICTVFQYVDGCHIVVKAIWRYGPSFCVRVVAPIEGLICLPIIVFIVLAQSKFALSSFINKKSYDQQLCNAKKVFFLNK